MSSPEELARSVAQRARARRLAENLTQAGLAAAAGVSAGTLKRFERDGQITFVSLVRIAVALDATAELETWFAPAPFRTLDEAIARAGTGTGVRQRGRKK
ncbi:MAG: helix-turn-helix transcriptional regulator [Pseudomonadota bacterium]|nr:helix-turn-helix transcriptional regulator [Pseudomonadota bacterium]